MQLLSFRTRDGDSFGIRDGESVIDLLPIAAKQGGTLRSLLPTILAGGTTPGALRQCRRLPLADIEFLPVIPDPGKILCAGINYASHLKETGRETPKFPTIFTRFAESQVGHQRPLIRPRVSQHLDFEGELAVIIGKPARYIAEAQALSYIAGYSCYNDGSVRDWQRHTSQFTPGKNFPQTGGFGPWLVTADEIADPAALDLTTRVNGEVMQRANTSDMLFNVKQLLSYCSNFTTLVPGDVIITGTTGGVGAFRQPPLWLKPGDTVEVEISGIGTLQNSVQDE